MSELTSPSTAVDDVPRVPRSSRVRTPFRTLWMQNLVWVMLVAFVVLIGSRSSYFLTAPNLKNVLVQATALGLLSLAVATTLLLGEIDLSVVGNAAFSGTVAVVLMADAGLSGGTAIVVALVVGVLIGGINGLLISRLRANSLITTLAMGLLLTGAVLAITQGQTVTVESELYLAIGSTRVAGWPLLPLLLLVAFLFAGVLFNHTAWGRSLYATGGNRRAANAAGINVGRVRTTAFMLSGLFSAAAGVALTSYLAGVSSNTGSNLLLYAIAAPVIGGVSLIGGRGRVVGVLGGTLLLTVVQLGLQVVDISPYYVQMVGAGMILFAVVVDALRVRSEGPEK